MTLLVLGLFVWIAAHVFKPAAPEARAAVAARLGAGPSRGLFATLILLGLLLMILGYRDAPYVAFYAPPAWTVHVNNLLMLGSVFLFGMSMSKGRTRSWLRHPQLTAVVVWAVAHLLVNGHVAALVLFGGLGLWALASMALINARDRAWVRPAPGPLKGDLRLVLITLVLYALITAVHGWLGAWPFPG